MEKGQEAIRLQVHMPRRADMANGLNYLTNESVKIQ